MEELVGSEEKEDWAADGSAPGQDVEEERRQTEQSGLRPGPPHPPPLLPHSPHQGHRPDRQLRRQADIWTLLSAAVSHRPASDLGLVELEIRAEQGRIFMLLRQRKARNSSSRRLWVHERS